MVRPKPPAHSTLASRSTGVVPTPGKLLVFGLVGLVWLAITGCGFTPDKLDERRCKNDDACLVRYGTDEEGLAARRWKCIQGYCQERTCGTNLECDNGIFCDGDEACDPSNDTADAYGCVPVARDLGDGIECTRDYCDEVLNQVLHDPAHCPCTGAGDQRCVEMNNNGCATSTCNPATFECDTTLMPSGTGCDDNIECTRDTTCDDLGRCVVNLAGGGSFDDDFCSDDQDGFFCNGTERCAPDEAGSDPLSGCIPGQPPTPTPADDGIACTEVVCDEERDQVFHAPTNQCGCRTDADCASDDCMDYTCTSDFTCEATGPTDADTPCNDGIACTGAEVCDGAGNCVGTPSDLYCRLNTACSSEPTCDPTSGNADATTGCVCTNP